MARRIIMLLILLLSVVTVEAFVTKTMSYEGYLTDRGDNRLSGTYTMNFSIYSASTGGALLWDERGQSVLVTNGVFTHILGSVKPINLTGSQNYYLEIMVNGETLTPRSNLTMSLWAEVANNLTEENNYKIAKLTTTGITSTGNITAPFLVGQATNLSENNNYNVNKLTATNNITAPFFVGQATNLSENNNYNVNKLTVGLNTTSSNYILTGNEGLVANTLRSFWPFKYDNGAYPDTGMYFNIATSAIDFLLGGTTFFSFDLSGNPGLYIWGASGNDNDYIYWDDSSKWLRWSDSGASGNDRFEFNAPLNVSGGVNTSELGVDYNARISHALQVGNPNENYDSPGDASFAGKVNVNNSLNVKSLANGAGLIVTEAGTTVKSVSMGGTTTYDGSTSTICDTTAPFTASNIGDWLGLSAPADYAGIMGEIIVYYNTSCVQVADYDGSPAVTFTGLSYYVFSHPDFAVMNGGAAGFTIGHDSDDRLHIYAPNATSSRTVFIEQTTGAVDNRALGIRNDMNNISSVENINSYMYSNKTMEGAIVYNLVLGLRSDYINNTEYDAIIMNQIGNKRTGLETEGINFVGTWDKYIYQGSEDTLTAAFRKNATEIENATTAFSTAGTDWAMFRTNNAEIYVGSDVNFTEISFSLVTPASTTITPNFFYCKRDGSYGTLTVSDTTTGFTKSGTITFTNPTDRAACNQAINGTIIPGGNKTYIAIRRTKANVPTTPTERLVTISGSSTTFLLQQDLLKLQPKTAPPKTCTAGMKGALYFDNDVSRLCFCDGANWLRVEDGTTGCS